MSRSSRVLIVATGGTLGITVNDRAETVNYLQQGRFRSAEEVVGSIPELRDIADVVPLDYRGGSLRNIGPDDWRALSDELNTQLAEGQFDGIVVTHGTNMLEETAYFLNLTIRSQLPVVVVGAMRPHGAIISDCDSNIVDAVRIASSETCRGYGVVVAMNGLIHSSREVTKVSTYAMDAFEAGQFGCLGVVDPDGAVVMYRKPLRRHTENSELHIARSTSLPRVATLFSQPDGDPALIEAAVDSGYRGLVVAGPGPGTLHPAELEALDRAMGRGVAVVVTSRTASGRVISSQSSQSHALITAGDLPAWKASVLLRLALAKKYSLAAIQRAFDEH